MSHRFRISLVHEDTRTSVNADVSGRKCKHIDQPHVLKSKD